MKLALVLLAVIAAVGAGGAAAASKPQRPRLLVLPRSPIVGQPSVIEYRGRAKGPVSATISGPGVAGVYRLPLRRAGARRWRGTYVFGGEGNWIVATRRVTRLTFVRLPPVSSFTPPGKPGCAPASPANPASGEVLGSGGLWALRLTGASRSAELDGVVGKQRKIIWRMGGSGDLSLVAVAPNGSRLTPDWLEPHTGASSWTRPGNEWGSGFTFTRSGCWNIHATRQGASGDVWVVVRS